jgi:diguanylate cyclase (GGDEF)-like protein/PAS domain S-box-containing protein
MITERNAILIVSDPSSGAARFRDALLATSVRCSILSPSVEAETLRAAWRQHDVVLVDLPSSNGGARQLLSEVRQCNDNPPDVIALGADDDAQGASLLREGASAYILKDRATEGTVVHEVRVVSERRAMSAALAQSEARYKRLLGSVTDYTYTVFIENGRAVSSRHSPGCEAVTGYAPENYEADPNLWYRMIHDADRDAVLQMSAQIIAGRTPPPLEHRIVHRDGSVHWIKNTAVTRFDQQGRLTAYDGLVSDITERKQAEEDFRRAAYYDSLTGLPNRELFYDRLQQALVHSKRHEGMIAVMLLDLDRFKEINDTLGHRAGDLLLRSAAERLKGCVWESDTVARHGGDEFTFLFPGIRQAQDAAIIAKKIIQKLNEGHLLLNEELFITASIGISLYPVDSDDADTLIRFADVAMYQSKAQGGSTYQFYTHSMNAEAHRRLLLEGNLRKALEREEFVLHYQPQVDLATGRIMGNEALIRWQHPTFGLLAPREFIPVAEDTGLIIPIGEWVIEKACEQNRAWQEAGCRPLRMAVNLSMRQFRQNDVTKVVAEALEKSGLQASFLDLELTESVIMKDAAQTIETLRELKSLGVHLTIDDFGTGYSSLRYLKDLPLNAVKLDQSFVSTLPGGSNEAISKTIIALARNLQLRVIAEGVETAGQLECLRNLGCEEVQGYLFSRPVPAKELTPFLTKYAC